MSSTFLSSVSEHKKNVFMKLSRVAWEGDECCGGTGGRDGKGHSFKQGGLGRPHGREPLRKDLKVRKIA